MRPNDQNRSNLTRLNKIMLLLTILFAASTGLFLYRDIFYSASLQEMGTEQYMLYRNVLHTCGAGIFIGQDEEFGTERLNKPQYIRVNPLDPDEFYVSDSHNHCIYAFSREKELLRTIDYTEAGPDYYFDPRRMDFDEAGNLYVEDFRNRNIAVFSPGGAFLKAIPVGERRISSGFSAISLDSVLISKPETGWYMTLINGDGDVVSRIGSIDAGDEHETVLKNAGKGFPFFDKEKKTYYLFVCHSGRIRLYDRNGEFIIETEPEIPAVNFVKRWEDYYFPTRMSPTADRGVLFFIDVDFVNGTFHVLTPGMEHSYLHGYFRDYLFAIHELDRELHVQQIALIAPTDKLTDGDWIDHVAYIGQFGYSPQNREIYIPGLETGRVGRGSF